MCVYGQSWGGIVTKLKSGKIHEASVKKRVVDVYQGKLNARFAPKYLFND